MVQKLEKAEITCPNCATRNDPEAIFCINPRCKKALGEFRYSLEEVKRETSPLQRVADTIAGLAGTPHFITAHIIWFTLWIGFNTGVIALVGIFDEYPYGLLGIILSIEATLISSFLLISNNRQNDYANKRSELDYEVNVKSYRRITEMGSALEALTEKFERLETQLGRKPH